MNRLDIIEIKTFWFLKDTNRMKSQVTDGRKYFKTTYLIKVYQNILKNSQAQQKETINLFKKWASQVAQW